MEKISNNIEKLGFDNWFQSRIEPGVIDSFAIARVVAVHKDSYTITNGENDYFAELVGKIIFSAASPLDYPAVGDWVLTNFYDDDVSSIIYEVLQRRSLLKRKTPGKKVNFQLIAANIDVAFIVQSLDENFNIRRLERYLAMINEGNIQPMALFSKSDLLPEEEVESKINEIKNIMPNLQTLAFSNENEAGLKAIREIMKPGLTYCLLGSSGVGKTTLLNNLIGESKFKTKTVSKVKSKGRHATTQRQLIKLNSGAMIVDTPGMRELGNFAIETGLDETFSEITQLLGQCQFSDCTHVNQKGCAVLSAVESGQIAESRYQNYMKMNKEAAFNEMSYLEKRKKDRQFSKFCKDVMKDRKKNRL